MAGDSMAGVGLLRPGEETGVPLRSPLDAFVQTLGELFATDPRLVLLTADQAVEARLEPLFAAHPDRCRNLGSAERNVIGVAAGMAAAGKVPVAVLSGSAASQRAADLLRATVARSGLHVIIAAYPAGIEGRAGSAMHALSDFAALLSIPGLRVVAPADAVETGLALKALVATPSPAYLRLIGAELPIVTEPGASFEIGAPRVLREGTGIAIFSTGALTHEAVVAADLLAAEGTGPKVLHLAALKPMDLAAVRRVAREATAILVAEEHHLRGGLGALIAQEVAGSRPIPIEFVAVDDRFISGSEVADLRTAVGLRAANIVAAVKRLRDRTR
jgi:transketolase